MIRRRFYSSYKSPVDNGVYAVKQDGRLMPLSKADYQYISVAIVHDDHKIMIEKNEDSNQSYKDASAGYNRSYLFYWGGYDRDQPGITNYNKLYESDTSGYLKSELGLYLGTPNLPANITDWTNGALSDWDGLALIPSGPPPPSHRLPVLFGFLLVLSSKFHIFGTKL